jgi:sialate O-acetylesterase
MKSLVLLLIPGCLLASSVCSAKVVLPSVFSDHMVLERNSKAAVWGWADPGETIKVVGTWALKDTVRTQASNDGHWRVDLQTGVAGGPYILQVFGAHSMVALQDVMLGEVWICSGQSNMEFTANWGLENKAAEIAQADVPGVRFFHVPRIGAPYPQQDCRAAWEACTPQTMPNNTAVGYYFARQLSKTLKVPVGIIEAAWGGTPAEVWVRADRVTSNPELVAHQFDDHATGWPVKEGVLYNGMISPFIPYKVAGALWYQGESNTHRPGAYATLMDSLVAGWRRDFGQNFSFYFVQIAPYTYDSTTTKAFILREQQDLAQKMIPGSGMVVIGDITGDIHDIHPKNKLDVGLRLANYALAETYHHPGTAPYQSPSYKSMKVEGSKVVLSFNHAKGGLVATGKDIPCFQIAGADGQFVEAHAEIKGDEIVVSAAGIKAPRSVRYCFTNSGVPTVFLKKGHLPLAPFRTDTIHISD